VNVADRVNLGLLPSSESSWSVACAALKSDSGGILHVHGNVTSGRQQTSHSTTLPACETLHCDGTASSAVSDQTIHCTVDDSELSQSTSAGSHSDERSADAGDSSNARQSASDDDTDSVLTAAAVRKTRFTKTCQVRSAWRDWADTVCETLRCHLSDILRCDWSVSVLHVEHVKSYAPHIDHVVADIECRPPPLQ